MSVTNYDIDVTDDREPYYYPGELEAQSNLMTAIEEDKAFHLLGLKQYSDAEIRKEYEERFIPF